MVYLVSFWFFDFLLEDEGCAQRVQGLNILRMVDTSIILTITFRLFDILLEDEGRIQCMHSQDVLRMLLPEGFRRPVLQPRSLLDKPVNNLSHARIIENSAAQGGLQQVGGLVEGMLGVVR